jgi:hypothetical protein
MGCFWRIKEFMGLLMDSSPWRLRLTALASPAWGVAAHAMQQMQRPSQQGPAFRAAC